MSHSAREIDRTALREQAGAHACTRRNTDRSTSKDSDGTRYPVHTERQLFCLNSCPGEERGGDSGGTPGDHRT
jgi:hypothetical protein